MSLRTISHFCAVALLAAAVFLPQPARAGANDPEPYKLTKTDLKLIEELNAADRVQEQEGFVYHDPALEAHLAALVQPMLPATPPEKVEWHIRIVRDPVPGAMSLANGSIYINTGLFSLLENDDQLAGVLGHEITHVLNRHMLKENRDMRNKSIAMAVLYAGFSVAPVSGWAWFTALNTIYNVSGVVAEATIFGYSRELEHEADENAVVLMKQCGRDPAQLARTFELIDERLEPVPVPIFFLDHPKLQERIAYVKSQIGAGTPPAVAGKSVYYESYQNMIRRDIRLDLDGRRFRTAVARAERLANAHPGDAEDLFLLGEAFRMLGPRTVKPSEEEQRDAGQRAAYKQKLKRTEEEEDQALAATPAGHEDLLANQAKAEECYRKAAAADPQHAKPHLGLGTLYEQQGKTAEALSEYRKYVELASGTPDARRVQYRIERLQKQLQPAS